LSLQLGEGGPLQGRRLTPIKYASALKELRRRDEALAAVIDRFGDPPIWEREPGFATLVHIILEQQVSLASAKAAFDRLCRTVSPLTPASLLTLDDQAMKVVGFSRQKARYARRLSQAILDGILDLEGLETLDDQIVRAALLQVDGVGPWTADIYMLMAMLRPDIWPAGDLALATALGRLKRLNGRPDVALMHEMAESWRPWRAVAARVLWHYYLSW
jgi:DNA-3-methyladenine glycosylase II